MPPIAAARGKDRPDGKTRCNQTKDPTCYGAQNTLGAANHQQDRTSAIATSTAALPSAWLSFQIKAVCVPSAILARNRHAGRALGGECRSHATSGAVIRGRNGINAGPSEAESCASTIRAEQPLVVIALNIDKLLACRRPGVSRNVFGTGGIQRALIAASSVLQPTSWKFDQLAQIFMPAACAIAIRLANTVVASNRAFVITYPRLDVPTLLRPVSHVALQPLP
jgi:hypothetical protein